MSHEVYYIKFEPALRLLLKACQLHELATTASVKLALTVDGADLVGLMSQWELRLQMNAEFVQ